MGDEESLNVIEPPAVQFSFHGEPLKISALRVGQIPAIMRALQGVDLSDGFELDALNDLIALHGDQVIDAVAIAIAQPSARVAELLPDEFIELAAKVLEVNGDFFVQRAAPAMKRQLAAISKRKADGVGATQFKH